jgi:peptidoglycan/LPS O-acetylase OafA/YrhL
LSSIGFLRAIRLPGDYSYGIYVYGWPVRQSVVEIWPRLGIHGNQAVSMAVAFLLAIFSWHVVEKPSIALGRRLAAALSSTRLSPEAKLEAG